MLWIAMGMKVNVCIVSDTEETFRKWINGSCTVLLPRSQQVAELDLAVSFYEYHRIKQ